MAVTDVEERLARLERAVQVLEDERAINRLLTIYGPLVDSGSAEAVADLWEADGVYDVDERLMVGHEQIEAMVRGESHQGYISHGCAHFLGPAHISVDGDEAVAVCYSLMVLAEGSFDGGGGFRVRRATANHFKLRRGVDGWRVQIRTARVLDGRPESPALLASGASTTPAVATTGAPSTPAAGDRTTLVESLYAMQTAIDERDWDRIEATFLPDSIGYGATGRDNVLEKMKHYLGGVGPTQHLLGNPVVEIDGETGRTRCYARVYHVGAGGAEGDFFECMGEYDDQWRRVSGRWRLVHRKFGMRIQLGDFGVLRPAEE